MNDDKPAERYKALSIISIVLGSLALLTSWIPFVNNGSAVIGVIALILGIIALLINLKRKKILSIIGTVLSILSIIVVIATQATYSSVIEHATNHSSKGTVANTEKDTSTEKEESKKNILTVDYKDYEVKSVKTYNINYQNTDWAGTDIKIDSAKVYKLDKTYTINTVSDGDMNVNGFIELNMSVTPQRDINIYPTQATGIFNNGEQHDASSDTSWDGEIAKGATKSGKVIIPITNLESDSSISSLRLKFSANYDTDDYNDDNSHHDYDITINLAN